MELHEAVGRGDCCGVKLLLANGSDVESADEEGRTPLRVAVDNEKWNMTKILLEHGAQTGAIHCGSTVLCVAACVGNVSIVQLLIEHGAKIEEMNNDGFTPLRIAVVCNRMDTVELLLKCGANIETQSRDRTTPLWIATFWQLGSIVELLLRYGADVEGGVDFVFTPLWLAIGNRNVGITQLLLEYGANTEIVNENGELLADMCGEYSMRELVGTHRMARIMCGEWIMKEPTFWSYIQWLPREMLEDGVRMVVKLEKVSVEKYVGTFVS
jgi:ankyrin repeat protein